MQNFKDANTGEYRSFEDDVRIERDKIGVYSFYSPSGAKLITPPSLQPTDDILKD